MNVLTEQMKEKFTIISNDKDKKEGLVEISSDHDYDTDKESVSSDSLPTQLKSKEVTIEQSVRPSLYHQNPLNFHHQMIMTLITKPKLILEITHFITSQS